jgi:hypothetical protein
MFNFLTLSLSSLGSHCFMVLLNEAHFPRSFVERSYHHEWDLFVTLEAEAKCLNCVGRIGLQSNPVGDTVCSIVLHE